MSVVKSRWLALAAICLCLTFVSGCQIDSSTGSGGSDLQYIKITPDLNLHSAPEGYIYELWILSVNIIDDSIPELSDPTSVVRFDWDPYLYAATDADGNFLPLTLRNGMEITTFDVNPFFNALTTVGFITVEPVNDPAPAVPNGPTIVAQQLNQESGQATLLNSWAILPIFQIPAPTGSYFLLSQSNKKGTANPNWRDNETEGFGIWFANPRLEDETTLDSVSAWEAYTRTFVPAVGDAYLYSIWIHMTNPESSFSNFGRVLANREPDFEFRDGLPSHAPGRFGPSDRIDRPVPQPDVPGVQLGTDPVLIDNQVVGYRYIYTHPDSPNRTDTCIVRVDNPALTRCNSDTFQVLQFDEIDTLPKAFRITNGDTAMGPSLAGLLDLSNFERLNQITFGNAFIFLGWEYEAWLVFTDESGIPPMSLGRFKGPSGFDSKNPYTYTDSRYDRNFQFPGEDFLQNLSSHDASLTEPLDVIYDPRAEKIWITIEPDDDFGFDWAPDEPNTQLIYLSGFLPKRIDTLQSMQFPLTHRDLNPSPTGLNEGNFFPTVTVQFLPAPSE